MSNDVGSIEWMKERQRQQDAHDKGIGYINSWRVTVHGIAIEQSPARLDYTSPGWSQRMCEMVAAHYRDALTVPGWRFNADSPNSMSAADWLAFQSKRLAFRLLPGMAVEVVPPGAYVRLAPALW